MSALVALPEAWRKHAIGAGLTDIDATWKACFEWHVAHEKDCTQKAWESWVARERTVVKIPKSESQKGAGPKPVGSSAPTPHTIWKEPAEWAEARKLDHDNKLAIQGCKTILAVLDAIDGKTTKLPAPQPGTHAMMIDPTCPKCGRLANGPHGSTCGRSDCAEVAARKESGAPVPPATEHNPVETLGGLLDDAGFISQEDEHGSEENSDGREWFDERGEVDADVRE